MVTRSHIPQQGPGHLAPEEGWGHPHLAPLAHAEIRALLSQMDLHIAARLMYALLLTHADAFGYIMVPNDTIAAAAKVSKGRARHLLYELRDSGYIEWVRRGAFSRPTLWRIVGVQATAA